MCNFAKKCSCLRNINSIIDGAIEKHIAVLKSSHPHSYDRYYKAGIVSGLARAKEQIQEVVHVERGRILFNCRK